MSCNNCDNMAASVKQPTSNTVSYTNQMQSDIRAYIIFLKKNLKLGYYIDIDYCTIGTLSVL